MIFNFPAVFTCGSSSVSSTCRFVPETLELNTLFFGKVQLNSSSSVEMLVSFARFCIKSLGN